MPMPHRTQMQLIRRRLTGKEGTARIKELRAILSDLPNYKNGPYADLRKWVNDEIARSRTRTRTVHRDSIAVRREGAAQIAVVGAPNAGKSSLLQALSNIQIKTGDYAFTTTRPVAATCRIGGVRVQLVEIPGLLRGANANRGGGRALLGVLRGADGIVYCHPATGDPDDLADVMAEVSTAGITLPALVALTRCDEAPEWPVVARLGDLPAVLVSVLVDASLDDLRTAIWELTGRIRIHLRKGEVTADEPLAFVPPVTVAEVATAVHHELGRDSVGARIWGASARFPGQRVGRDHQLADDDIVEVLQ